MTKKTEMMHTEKTYLQQKSIANIRTIVGLCYGVHKLAPHLGLVNEDGKPDYMVIDRYIAKKFSSKTLKTITIKEQKQVLVYFKLLKSGYSQPTDNVQL